MKINILAFFFFIALFSSCTEEVTNTLVYPTSFRFNTPLLESRSVYQIDTFSTIIGNNKVLDWKFTPLTEELGAFNRSNTLISDTLNAMIRESFEIEMISSITLLSTTKMEIEYGKLQLGATPLDDKINFARRDTITYQATGNFLIPGMYLNNDSREIYICNEFIYASNKSADNKRNYSYFRNGCNGADTKSSLSRFVRDNNFAKFDTASVEYINFIFSSYK
jgi:hypothetical protein